jgi:hypothetical protein
MKIIPDEDDPRWGRVFFSKEDYNNLGKRIDASFKQNPEKELKKVKDSEKNLKVS